MKPIRLSAHALGYRKSRGFTIEEVEETIRTSAWEPADLGKLEARREFPFGQEWHGKPYEIKQLRPNFVEETGEIVVITVYTYFY